MGGKFKNKLGKTTLAVALLSLLLILFFIFLSSAGIEEKNYTLGQDVKIDLSQYDNYVLKINTPTKTLIREGSKEIFLFNLDELGKYNFKLTTQDFSKNYNVEVVEEIVEVEEKEDFVQSVNVEEEIESLNKITLENSEIIEEINNSEEFIDFEILEEIRVGEKVKWVKNVTLNESELIVLPSYSENIQVFQNETSVNYTLETTLLDEVKTILSIEIEKKVLIESNDFVEVTYETPAPIKEEKEINENKKEVIVSSDIHYENVFTTTKVIEKYNLEEKDLIKIYWTEENKYLDFLVYDTNDNGLIDEIGWTVPHLSTQTFEIILISKAEHLDENKVFIEEVYDKVKEIDYNFVNVSNNEYLRVTFEKNLTSEKDITLYARGNGSVQVYKENSEELITEFPTISEYNVYKIYLTNLSGEEDTFDLKVLGEVEFDYVVDPSSRYHICYFNAYSFSDWDSGAANMVNGNTASYASDNDNNGRERLSANNCSITDLGQITSVEARYFGRKNNNAVTIRASLRPVFSSVNGTTYDPGNILTSTGAYISWINITGSTGAPSTWTWTNISNLDMDVFVTRPNTGTLYVSQVELRITYLGNDAPTHSVPYVNSTLGTNTTVENLTCIARNTADFDGDTVKNIFNWYKNGTSLAKINLPFEGNDTTRDFSFNGYDFTSIDAVFNRTGGYDSFGAYVFNGSNYLNVSKDLSTILGKSGTLSFWIKTTQTGSDTMWQAPGITGVEQSGGGNDIFWGWIDATGHIGITVGNGAATKSTNAINNGNYHHVVLTRNSTSGRIEVYVDGILNSNATSETGDKTISFSSIGRIEDTGGTPVYFNGSIDDLLVFDFVLSQEQIKFLNNSYQNISRYETEVGDNFTCSVTPTDSYLNGQTLTSSGLIILEEIIPKVLGLSLIYPTASSVYVEKDKFFNVTLNVTCLSGNCGTVNVTLDPIVETYNDFETGTEGFEHFALNEKVDQWHVSSESARNGTYSWKSGDSGSAAYASLSDSVLVSPTYEIEGNSTFSFYHYLYTEEGYDGGILEYRINETGSWTKFDKFISGGYNDQYQEYSGGPNLINGEDIWSGSIGSSSSFQQVVLNMSGITSGNITFRFHFFTDSSVTREGWYIDSVNFTTTTPSMDKGIIPVGSGNPFYTNATSNPLTTNSLSSGQSQIVTFYVNATGDLDRKYIFFSYANLTSDLSIGNITNKWNVTISVDEELPEITINYPTSGNINDATPVLDIDLTGRAKDLWYNINGGANQTLCSSCNFSNDEVLYLREANYTVNIYASNPMGEIRHEAVFFQVDLNNNYYDSYLDDSYVYSNERLDLLNGNITLELKQETIINQIFSDSDSWALIGGQWQINTNKELAQRQDATDSFAVYNVLEINNETDYNVSYRLYSTDNDYSGFVFGYKNSTDYYRCQVRQQAPIDAEIVRVSGGTETTISTYSDGTSYSLNTWNTMILEIKNHTVSCYVNGILATRATEVNFPIGYFGIYNDINDEARHDNFTAIVTGGRKSGYFTSYAVDLVNTITRFTNITWNEYTNNANNTLSVEVSADNGANWYTATKNSPLTSIVQGDKFIYRVFFSVEDISLISLLDLNISWSNTVEPPPQIFIEGVNLPTEQDFSPVLNVTLNKEASSLLMSINGKANQTICTSCLAQSYIFPVILEEGSQIIRFYANNTAGTFSMNSTNFLVNFDKYYFDNFTDNYSIKEFNNAVPLEGNITFYGGIQNSSSIPNWDANVQTGDSSWANSGRTTYSYRNILNSGSINASGDYVRIKFVSGTDGTLTINNPSICERYGTTSNCVGGTWQRLKFGGADSYAIPISSEYFTDWLEYEINSSKNYMITFYVGSTNNAVSYLSPSSAMIYSISASDRSLVENWSSLSPTSENLMYSVDSMEVMSSIVGGTGNFTSHTINTTQPITSFSHVSWTETGVSANNNITLQLSVNNGANWVSVTNGGSAGGFTAGSKLIYRVLYSAISLVNLSITDLNITWQSPPAITIHYPQNYVYNQQITQMNYTVSYAQGTTLDKCWYTLNGGATNTTVNCNQNITGITSNTGVNTWTIYVNDTSGMTGYSTVNFTVDTTAPVITFLNQTNEEGQIVNSTNPLYVGDDLTLNVNVTDSNTNSVWVVIWENIVGGVVKTKIFFNNVFGNLWSADVPTNESFGESYNYTIYANDTSGLNSSYNGTFNILKLVLNLNLNPSVSEGNENISFYGYLNFSNGTIVPNHAINFWIDNTFLPFSNLTRTSSQSALNFSENEIKYLSTYDNTSYSSGEFTLDGTNTSGSFSGILDAGAKVNWSKVYWTNVQKACSATVDYQDGNANSYSGTEDSYITSLNQNTNYGSENFLTVDSSPDTERSLVKFNEILGYGQNKIPYGATITSATFRLSVYDTGDNPNFYEVLEDWKEDEVTYTYRTNEDLWGSLGVTGVPSINETSIGSMNAATTGIKAIDVTSTVQKWASRTIPNYGFILHPLGSGNVLFRSSEYPTQNERPRLSATFTANDCTGVLVYVRTSNDKVTWTSWKEIYNGENINDSLGLSRYLEYEVVLGSFNSTYKPQLQSLNFSYAGLFTDANGFFNYTYLSTNVFGSYKINVTSGFKNMEGNAQSTLSVQSGVPPIVTSISPSNNTWSNTTSYTFYYNATDLNGDFSVAEFILDGVVNLTNQSIITSGTNNFTISGLSQGLHTWQINLSDVASTNTSEIRNFYVDLVNPLVNLVYPTDGSSFSVGYLNLSFNVTDNMDTSLLCNVTLDGSVINTTNVTNGTTINVTTPALSGGEHSWEVLCQDNSYRTYLTDARIFTISDTPPTVNLTSPENNYLDSDGNIEFIYYPYDNSGIDHCDLLINGVINSTSSLVDILENNSFIVEGFLEGAYNWSVDCYDLSLTKTSTQNRTFTVDLNSPLVNLVSPINNSASLSGIVEFKFNVTDNIDSNLNCSVYIDSVSQGYFNATRNVVTSFNSSSLYDGIRNWYINCSDDATHFGISETRRVNVTEYPKIYLNTTNLTYSQGNSFIVEFTPHDNSGINSCTVYLNGISNSTISSGINMDEVNSLEIEGLTDGIYRYYVNCTDTFGLSNSSIENTMFIDNRVPEIIIYSPKGEDLYSANITFDFKVIDSISSNLICNLTLDTNVIDENFSVLNNTNISRTLSGIIDGFHRWNVTCQDLAGNINISETNNFTKYTAPGVELVSPLNNSWVNSSNVEFIYFPQDDEGFSKTELIIDGAVYMANQSQVVSGVNNSFNVIGLADGIYNWKVNVTDVTSMIGSSETRKLYVDTHAPQINLVSPLESSTINTNNVTFNFNIVENLDDLIFCNLSIDGDVEFYGDLINGTNSISILLVDGNHNYELSCVDNATNLNVTGEINFTVYSPPQINLTSPVNEYRTNSSEVNFSYIPIDALGLENCSIYVDEVLEEIDLSILKNVVNNFTVGGIFEGKHNWSIGCFDTDLNFNMSSYRNFTRDLTAPIIYMNSPENNSGIDKNILSVQFSWRPVDLLDDALQCNLYVDSVKRRSDLWVNSNFTQVESISGLSTGSHNWSVECWDRVGNLNRSATYYFDYVYPDFNVSSISFNNTLPIEGDRILVNATINNFGLADSKNVSVGFYLQNVSNATRFYERYVNLSEGETIYLNSTFTTTIGLNAVYVIVDYYGRFNETNEGNNLLSRNLTVGSWQFFYGDVLAGINYSLSGASGDLIDWSADNYEEGIIFVSDKESVISWTDVVELGRSTSEIERINDFSEADNLLEMSLFSDSISNLYLSGGVVRETDNFLVFGKTLNNVPLTNSTDNNNFKTGILWDSSDDTNGEFDSTEKEDLIFVSKVNKDTIGKFGTYDYELRVPAKLREYVGTSSEAVFYVEVY